MRAHVLALALPLLAVAGLLFWLSRSLRNRGSRIALRTVALALLLLSAFGAYLGASFFFGFHPGTP